MSKRDRRLDLFYIPAIILFLLFVIYPFGKGIYLSLTNWNGYSRSMKFVGITNYINMFSDKNVLIAFKNTLIYGFGSTVIQNVLGILLAVFLNQEFKGKGIIRTVVYLPVMIAPLIMGYIMYFFFTYNNGAINDILNLFGIAPVDWLADGQRSIIILTLVNSLQFVGISMVLYLAGLQNISVMYTEQRDFRNFYILHCLYLHRQSLLLLPSI